MKRNQVQQRAPGASYGIRLVGEQRRWSDVYHAFLAASWPAALTAIVVVWLLANLAFALAYAAVGGVTNLPEGEVLAAFFFSVQTMGTIGYGGMFPSSLGAHLLVVVESVVGLLLTALSTGLVFAKFSQPQSRIVFSSVACVTHHEGRPTLIIRIGNERGNRVLEASVHLDVAVTTVTAEGHRFYRMTEARPVRARIPALSRTFNVMHVLDEHSPLHGLTEAGARESEVEVLVTVVGLDDTTGQSAHGQQLYEAGRLVFGRRFADVLSADLDGELVLDVSKFHDTVPDGR